MVLLSSLTIIVTISLTSSFVNSSPVPDPLRIPHSIPTEISSQIKENDGHGIRAQQKVSLQENLIQSSEFSSNTNCEIYEVYSDDQLKSEADVSDTTTIHFNSFGNEHGKIVSGKLDSAEGKERLSKFYRNGQRAVSTSELDTIVFPSSKSDRRAEGSLRIGEVVSSDIPVQSTSQIPPTEASSKYPFIHATTTESLAELQKTHNLHHSKIQNKPESFFPFLTPEQDILTYELLAQILRKMMVLTPTINPSLVSIQSTSTPLIVSSSPPTTEKIEITTFNEVEDTTTTDPNNGLDLDFQSLYSGPKVQKTPCPSGIRTQSGICQERSRKLQNTRG